MLKIGVVMPTYNQDKWIVEAIQSYLQQSYKGLTKLVVVNDGSTDKTKEILEVQFPKVPVVHQANQGSAAAINAGIQTFEHEDVDALSWISSDNVMVKEWLSSLAATMEECNAGAVYGGFWYLKAGKRDQYIFRYHDRYRLVEDVNCYYGPAFLIRKDVWLQTGSHRGRISHDYDHWLRVEETCYAKGLPIVGVDKPLCLYNAHDERVTVTRAHEFDALHWQAEARTRRGSQ